MLFCAIDKRRTLARISSQSQIRLVDRQPTGAAVCSINLSNSYLLAVVRQCHETLPLVALEARTISYLMMGCARRIGSLC